MDLSCVYVTYECFKKTMVDLFFSSQEKLWVNYVWLTMDLSVSPDFLAVNFYQTL